MAYPYTTFTNVRITGDLDAPGTLGSENVLVIRAVDDLPAASNGEHLLPAKTVLVVEDIDLGANALRLSTGTLLRGLGGITITSSAASGVIRATNLGAAVVIREVSIVATAGPCLALTGTTDHQLNIFFCGFFGASIGTVSGFDVQSFKDCFFSCADGIINTGTNNKIFYSQCPVYGITSGNAAITLAAALDARRVDIVNMFFKHDAAGIPLKAIAGYTVGYGRVSATMLDGPTTMLNGLTSADSNWWFRENDLVRNSRVAGQAFLSAAATTTITTQSVFVAVAGTFTLTDLTQRWTLNVNNEMVYSGLDPVTVSLTATFTIDPANNNRLAFRATKNGTTLAQSETIVEQGAGAGASPRPGAVVALIEIVNGDRVALAVANLSSTDDVPWLTCTYAVIA